MLAGLFFANFAPLHAAVAETRVVVLPVTAIASQGGDWIAHAVEASLLADLPHAAPGTLDAATSDRSKAIANLAQANQQSFIVSGQVQRVESSIRATAQLFDASGQMVASAKESGDERDLFMIEDKLAFDLRDKMRTANQSHRALAPMPILPSAGTLKMAPQPALPVGTVAVTYSSRNLREGATRNIYNTPYFEYDGLGWGGFGYGGGGFGGFGGFGFGGVGFATGGTGQGAY